MADEVLTEVRGRVLLITLNRPDAMNAINTPLAQGVLDAVNRLDQDPALGAGVLTGAGKGFCSGMDLKAFLAEGPPKGFWPFIENGCRKPLIAAVEGFALAGGLEMALGCDLIVAASGAKLGIPEVKVGLFAGAGGLTRLPRRAGYGPAMEMALTGDPLTAEQAHAHGLVARVAEPGGAVEAAVALAERIAGNAPLGLAASKMLIKASQGSSEAEFWKLQGVELEAVFTSKDAKEGPRAFAEKRAPNWSGK